VRVFLPETLVEPVSAIRISIGDLPVDFALPVLPCLVPLLTVLHLVRQMLGELPVARPLPWGWSRIGQALVQFRTLSCTTNVPRWLILQELRGGATGHEAACARGP
jgi:hypothetical protein